MFCGASMAVVMMMMVSRKEVKKRRRVKIKESANSKIENGISGEKRSIFGRYCEGYSMEDFIRGYYRFKEERNEEKICKK